MLDPFSALGVASSIIQVVDFGLTIFERANKIRKGVSPAEIRELDAAVSRFNTQAASLESSRIVVSAHPSAAENDLKVIAIQCVDLADRLVKALAPLKVHRDSGKWKSFQTAFKFEAHKSTLLAYHKELVALRSDAMATLLITINDRSCQVAQTLDDMQHRDSALEAEIGRRLDEQRSELKRALATRQMRSEIDAETLLAAITALVNEGRTVEASQRVLKSLWFEQLNHRSSQITPRHPKTYEWILESVPVGPDSTQTGFLTWLCIGSGLFWVSGKAGSGKSTLMKFLRHDPRTHSALRQWAAGSKLVMADYFFWNSGSDLQKSQIGLLRSLCFEILRQCPHLIPVLCEQRMNAAGDIEHDTDWTLAELGMMVDRLQSQDMVHHGQNVKLCFFIDGLDEYKGVEGDIIAVVRKMACFPNVKICASSRPWNAFQEAFGQREDRMMRLQDLTSGDIRLFVQDLLGEEPTFVDMQDEGTKCADLIDEITTKADGVFLWVFLVVRELRRSLPNGDGVNDLRRRVDSMPPDLDMFFYRIFASLDPFYQKHTAQILLLRLATTGRMDLTSLCMLDPEDKDTAELYANDGAVDVTLIERMQMRLRKQINSRCRDLLEVVDYGDGLLCVTFLHRTVQDFFLTEDMQLLLRNRAGLQFNLLKTLKNTSFFLLRFVHYLTIQTTKALNLLLVHEFMLYAYALENEQQADSRDELDALLYMADNDVFHLEHSNEGIQYSPRLALWHMIVEHGLLLYLQYLLKFRVNEKHLAESDKHSMLFVTVRVATSPAKRHDQIVKVIDLLLRSRADPNKEQTFIDTKKERHSQSPWKAFVISLLARSGKVSLLERSTHLIIAEELIKSGARLAGRCEVPGLGPQSEAEILTLLFGTTEARRLLGLRNDGSEPRSWWPRFFKR